MISLLITIKDNEDGGRTDITAIGTSCPTHSAHEAAAVEAILDFIKTHSGCTVHKDLRVSRDVPPKPGPVKSAKSDADALWAFFKNRGAR